MDGHSRPKTARAPALAEPDTSRPSPESTRTRSRAETDRNNTYLNITTSIIYPSLHIRHFSAISRFTIIGIYPKYGILLFDLN
jgi:hypothetical protein